MSRTPDPPCALRVEGWERSTESSIRVQAPCSKAAALPRTQDPPSQQEPPGAISPNKSVHPQTYPLLPNHYHNHQQTQPIPPNIKPKQPNQLPSIPQSTHCLLRPPQSPIQISVYSHPPHAPHSKPTSQNPLHSPTHLVPPPNPIPSIPIQIPLSLHPKPTPIKTPKNNSLYPPNHYIILL